LTEFPPEAARSGSSGVAWVCSPTSACDMGTGASDEGELMRWSRADRLCPLLASLSLPLGQSVSKGDRSSCSTDAAVEGLPWANWPALGGMVSGPLFQALPGGLSSPPAPIRGPASGEVVLCGPDIPQGHCPSHQLPRRADLGPSGISSPALWGGGASSLLLPLLPPIMSPRPGGKG
jgi:hypothetical protein